MIREIVREPDARLHAVCRDAELTDETRQLIVDMADTLIASGGLGIAAPQLGENVRIVLVADTFARKVFVALNPRITKRSPHRINSTEGCLSIPGFRRPASSSCTATPRRSPRLRSLARAIAFRIPIRCRRGTSRTSSALSNPHA